MKGRIISKTIILFLMLFINICYFLCFKSLQSSKLIYTLSIDSDTWFIKYLPNSKFWKKVLVNFYKKLIRWERWKINLTILISKRGMKLFLKNSRLNLIVWTFFDFSLETRVPSKIFQFLFFEMLINSKGIFKEIMISGS